jgi:hypothetical protein
MRFNSAFKGLNSPGICRCGFYPNLVAVIVNTTNLKPIKNVYIIAAIPTTCTVFVWTYGRKACEVKPEEQL